MTFNFFVLPFFIGLIFVIVYTIKRFRRWIRVLDAEDKVRLREGLRSPKFLAALSEIFFECLLHRKMFRKNPLLGYMHMSFAFGWFLLILVGNLESRVYSGFWINPPYYPIFLKFFIHDKHVLPFEIFSVPGLFRFLMDLLLLFTLSGLVLAILKRSRSNWFGFRQSTKHQLTDKVAMYCLWLIFPLRLFAESATAGAYGYGGGFVTQHFGNLIAFLWPFSDKMIAYAFWWAYSLSLGVFFVTLPYSRYMHIPTEVLLIVFRNLGIKAGKEYSGYPEVEVFSCSRCGICIDVCQISSSTAIHTIQPVYFIQSIRDQQVKPDMAMQCMVCGRCRDVCPVGIDTDSLRIMQRKAFFRDHLSSYSYLPAVIHHPKTEVLYFAGCMTHLTPSIIKAMRKILNTAGIRFQMLDEDGTICCGRPLVVAGKAEQAKALMKANIERIKASGAALLVASCPICLRVFREDYQLDIKVMHHSQYILELVKKGMIPIQSYFKRVAYHDPCELGRGCGIYDEPRELLRKVADLVSVEKEDHESWCCGGSLGLIPMPVVQREQITKDNLKNLLKDQPEVLVTACPLCKKTFAKHSPVEVRDIAEMISISLPGGETFKKFTI
jgi:Fe-S oxidoreductase